MPPFRQSSFAGGELAPEVWGRTDLSKYDEGLRRCRNCIIAPTGAVMNRPGTTFIAQVKDSSRKVRLIPFIYSDAQSYVLEFGHLYVRFISNSAQVESSPGVPLEIVTPYIEEHLPYLKYAQVGDVMTLTHSAYTTRELARTAHTTWALNTVSFDARSPGFGGVYPPALNINTPLGTPDATHPAQPWVWKVTKLELVDGVVRESAPYTVTKQFTGGHPGARTNSTHPQRIALYFDMPVTVDWNDGGLISASVIGWRIYRGQGNRFGLVGEVDAATSVDRAFVDLAFAPDYTQGPPQGRNPFKVYNSGGTLIRTEEPTAVAFFEQRRVFGRTDERPATLFFSRTDDYANFDDNAPSVDDEAIEAELASRKREEIRWLASFGQRLVAGSNASVWAISGAAGAPLTFASVDAKVQSEVGASWLDPIIAANSLLYVRAKGSGVRDLSFSNERGAYAGNDLTALAQHLFRNHQVVSWTWAEDPIGIVWAVREDGLMLSCAYVQEQGVFAWGWHDTQGTFEQVCSVAESVEDAVYVVVKRSVNGADVRYIERINPRDVEQTEVAEGIFLDSALSYEGVATSVVTGLSHLEGKEVVALADGQVVTGLTVDSGSVDLGLDPGATVIHVGLRYDSDAELLDLAAARNKAKTVKRAVVEVVASKGMWIGESETELVEAKFRRVSDNYAAAPLKTMEVEVSIRNTWNKARGRIFIRQKDPLPLTIVGVTREVEVGGE